MNRSVPLESSARFATCAQCMYPYSLETLRESLWVCPGCGHHIPVGALDRIAQLIDPQTFQEWDNNLLSADPLHFSDTQSYPDRLARARGETGLKEAVVTGYGTLYGHPVAIGIFDFRFIGGSMGSVVGEKICRLFFRAQEQQRSVVVVTASGGARMQEGIFSLMQMAKVSVAIARFKRHRLPYIAVLTHPTTGGVTASVGMLGDVIIAEPRALIGFAGPRVIEETIRAPLPSGFQRAERLLEHGLIDMVVSRPQLKETLADLLSLLTARGGRKEGRCGMYLL